MGKAENSQTTTDSDDDEEEEGEDVPKIFQCSVGSLMLKGGRGSPRIDCLCTC